MRKKALFSMTLAALLALTMVGCTPGTDDPTPGPDGPGDDDPEEPTVKEYYMPVYDGVEDGREVSVHDPSIFQDPADGKYYAFGTHFAVASSPDLINWTQEAGDNAYSVLYGNATYTYSVSGHDYVWPAALQKTLELVKPSYVLENGNDNTIQTTWAPDVEYYNGKYYMYYSLTSYFGSRHSAIGRVEADNVLGPYSNNRILIDSMDGTGLDPNCIDPELFYDKDGRLWMVYGSASGGIYIKELYNEGENWGLPMEDGYGTRLWSGTKNQEGPFIFYNETTGYYYLMVSYGSLMTTYNMRVARSENPDGPYEDITGLDVATATGDNGGNKIAGNYVLGDATGFAAIGHNSVIEKDGEYFVVAHARRQSGSGGVTPGHNVYVFQLYFNEDGWPVMNPNRYAGEVLGTGITADMLDGDYDLVIHTEGTTVTFAQSQTYTFAEDGTITLEGENVGTWALSGDYYMTVTLDGVEYNGVVTPSWSMYGATSNDNYPTFSITATSDTGIPLWAVGEYECWD